MKRLKMARSVTLTFEEGCNKYLENCRQMNLREGTTKIKKSDTSFWRDPLRCVHFYKVVPQQ